MSSYTDDFNLGLPATDSKDNGQVINANTQKINDGRTHKGTLGGTVAEYKVGVLDSATGKIVVGDSTDPDKINAVGFCTESGVLNDQRYFRCNGYIQNVAWSLSLGRVYMDASGDPSNTKSDVFLGLAVTSDTIWIIGLGGNINVGIYDAIVSADGTGDYLLPSVACSTEPIGSIIGVKSGVYTETGDIAFKEGQTLVGMGGIYGDSTPSGNSGVVVVMADYQLLLSNNTWNVEGIIFEFTPVTDEPNVLIAGSNGYGNRVQFISSGVATHDCVKFTGSDNFFNNTRIIGTSGTDKVIHFTGNRNKFNNLYTFDGEVALYCDSGTYHEVRNSRLMSPTDGAIGVTADDVILDNNYFSIVSGGTYEIDIPDGCDRWKITRNYLTEWLRIGGDYCYVDGNYMQTCAFSILATANNTIIGDNINSSSDASNAGTNTSSKRKYTRSSVDPTVTNDDDYEYSIGDEWYNYTDFRKYIAIDVTSGAAVWKIVDGLRTLSKSSAYVLTALDLANYSDLDITTGASSFTVTLPSLAGSHGLELIITKIDAGAGAVTLSRAGSDTFVDGGTTKSLPSQGSQFIVRGTVSGWKVL